MKKSNFIFGFLFFGGGLGLITQFITQPLVCTETRGSIVCGFPVLLAGVCLAILGIYFFIIIYNNHKNSSKIGEFVNKNSQN